MVPSGNALGLEAHRYSLSSLCPERLGRCIVQGRSVAGVAHRELPGQLEHRVEIAVDLGLRLDLDAAELAILIPGLGEQRRPRIALEVADLLRSRIGVDPDLAIARHVP